MKIKHLLLPLAVFIAFLIVGRWTGEQIERSVGDSRLKEDPASELVSSVAQIEQNNKISSFAPEKPNPTMPLPQSEEDQSGLQQRNILVIAVDTLDAPPPRLESVWLVLYLPDMAHVTLGRPSMSARQHPH